jgi:hypothetical protein
VCIFPLGVNHRQSRDALSKKRKLFDDKRRERKAMILLSHLVIDVLTRVGPFMLWSKCEENTQQARMEL